MAARRSPIRAITSMGKELGLRQLDAKSIFYMSLLALQFGIQPVLTRKYTSKEATRSTVVLTQELVKFFMALAMLRITNGYRVATKGSVSRAPPERQLTRAFCLSGLMMIDWCLRSWLVVALVPAALYSIQNLAALTAYQNLDALTFNVINQTKTLSAAICCYFVMGKSQSKLQIVALFLLLLSALVMEGVDIRPLFNASSSRVAKSTNPQPMGTQRFTQGVAPLLLASFISGLAGALSQKNLQAVGGGRNAYLFSMELCAASLLLLTFSLALSPDGQSIVQHGFWHGWTPSTVIPIATNSAGGIIVGLVTKHAGSVRKGFALIFGIFLSGVIQAVLQPELSMEASHIAGGVLAAVSMYLHSSFPPADKAKVD
jgi:solute carrier family 35 (UDP-sugar transporter), member A1/2/3